MHRLRSTSTTHRFWFAAFLLCSWYLLLCIACGVLLLALITYDHSLALIGGSLAGVTLFTGLLQWLCAAHTGCPLCMTPVLAKRQCVTHRHARAVCGSHRLRVALAVLFRGKFRCPYCNELTAIKSRKDKHNPPGDHPGS